MPMFTSPDGRILFAMETPNEGDGNSVVYYDGKPVWDRFTYEREHGIVRPDPDRPPPRPDPDQPPPPPPPPPGDGLIEHASSLAHRPRLSAASMQSIVPHATGVKFTIPGYSCPLIRLTNADSGRVHPPGMTYWPQINNHAGQRDLRVLLSVDGTLAVITVDKAAGAIVDGNFLPFTGTGEGCYWSWTQPNLIYVPGGDRLLTYDVINGQTGEAFRADGPITQCHTSQDGSRHSFTINGHAAVAIDGRIRDFHHDYGYDECQITRSGRYLLIKQSSIHNKQDNRIVDLDSPVDDRRGWIITDVEGALGHSDCEWNGAVGEEDQTGPGGVFRRWLYTPAGPVNMGVMYHVGGWDPMTRYISLCSANRDGQSDRQVALFSGATADDRTACNEISAVVLDGGLMRRVLCPNLTDITAGDDTDHPYWRITRATMDPVGEWFVFTGNIGGGRQDAFVGRLVGD